MVDFKKPDSKDSKQRQETILLRDLVSVEACACDYLALSVTFRDEQTLIKITTTDSIPVTYIAVLPKAAGFDCNSLLFVAQGDACPYA